MTIPNEQTGRDAPTIVEVSPADARRLVTEEKVSLDKRPKAEKLLTVKGLSTHFFTPDGVVQAVDDVSFELGYGETLGLVGESGCGKSVSALSVARLVPNPPGRIVAGEIVFDGIDVLRLADDDMRKLRGKEIGFIFQDPLTSLNPTLTIGYQIGEAIKQHMGLSAKASTDRVVELLSKVGIPRAKDRLNDYPHQFSGGMRQRVMIAIALSCDPKLILADEPTTALDVTIQAQILELISVLSDEFGTAVLLITHIPAAMPRSWVINSTAVWNSSDSVWISSRIWAWIVTSNAVVGSSARMSFGSHDRAIAIITRWRIPPENWCG